MPPLVKEAPLNCAANFMPSSISTFAVSVTAGGSKANTSLSKSITKVAATAGDAVGGSNPTILNLLTSVSASVVLPWFIRVVALRTIFELGVFPSSP